MYSVGSWLLIALLAFQAVAHLVLTVLFYAGAHDQGYGYFLDFRWPSWLITVLDVVAATSLWWVHPDHDLVGCRGADRLACGRSQRLSGRRLRG
jgi:hypothetical protein